MSAYILDDPKPIDFLYTADLYFELFFVISMVIEFLTEFIPTPGSEPIRDPILIAQRYIKG